MYHQIVKSFEMLTGTMYRQGRKYRMTQAQADELKELIELTQHDQTCVHLHAQTLADLVSMISLEDYKIPPELNVGIASLHKMIAEYGEAMAHIQSETRFMLEEENAEIIS